MSTARHPQQLEWVLEGTLGGEKGSEGKQLAFCFDRLQDEKRISRDFLAYTVTQTLQFVAETGKARPWGHSRHLIRSHASRGTKKSTARSRVVSSRSDLTSRSRHQQPNFPNEPEFVDLDQHLTPEIGKLDPFASLPIAGQSKVHSLLSHLDRVVRRSRGLPGPREGWLTFAISDSAVLTMMLFISSLNIAGLSGKAITPDILYWKGETIRLINKRLGDPTQVASDGTIAAVAALAHLENFVGTSESARIHAKALGMMVKSRGGLQNLGEHEMPRRIVLWSDICASIILETKPRYDVDIKKNRVSWPPLDPLTLRYQRSLFNLTGLYEMSEEAVEIYWEIRNFSRLKEESAFHDSGGDEIENIPYTETLYYLERRLLPLTQSEPLSHPSQIGSIFTLFGYAALIHVYLFLRDSSKDLPFTNLLSNRIRIVLEKVDMRELKMHCPEMMLWILMMGGLSGSALSERDWFAKQVAGFCRELNLYDGDQLATFLEKFLWSELYRSPVTGRFWDGVSRAQGSKQGYEVRRLPDHISVACFNAPPDFENQN